MPARTTRAVILFSRSPREEEACKHLPSGDGRAARELFAAVHARLAREVAEHLPGVALVVAGSDAVACAVRLDQRGGTFGERLAQAVDDARRLGFEEIVLVGGDVPALTARHLTQAFRQMGAGRLVLGPCPDGGVYLIGGRARDVAPLLSSVRWMTAHVQQDLGAAAGARSCEVTWLDALRDVDDRLDLARLLEDRTLDAATMDVVRRILSPRWIAAASGPRAARPGASLAHLTRGPPAMRHLQAV